MHFANLPPEINSVRMFSGPGSASMMSAAAAWDGLAARLCDMAAKYRSLTAGLPQRWRGPAAVAMIRSVPTHVEWLEGAAAQAEQAAAQARAAASAYESALAAMAPPAAIDANRARRRALASANCLGQAAAAIADTEAAYERMWAEDADALYAYAGASADASKVTLFTSPQISAAPAPPRAVPACGKWALRSAPDVLLAGHQVMSAIPAALEELSSTPLTTFDVLLSPVTSSLSKLGSLSAPSGVAISYLNSRNKAAALQSLLPRARRRRTAAPTAGFGRGTSIGSLSVPRTWPRPAPAEPAAGWACEPIRLVAASEPPISPSCS